MPRKRVDAVSEAEGREARGHLVSLNGYVGALLVHAVHAVDGKDDQSRAPLELGDVDENATVGRDEVRVRVSG